MDGLCVHLVLGRVLECGSVPGLRQAGGCALLCVPYSAVSERGHVFGDCMANHWCTKHWTLRRACTGLEDHLPVGRYQSLIMVVDLITKASIHLNLGLFCDSEGSMTPECEPRYYFK